MNRKTSVILTATMASVMTLVTLAVAVPAPVMAGSASGGVGGTGGDAGNGGIGGVGGIAVFGFANGGDANGGHGGDANGGYAQCQTGLHRRSCSKKLTKNFCVLAQEDDCASFLFMFFACRP